MRRSFPFLFIVLVLGSIIPMSRDVYAQGDGNDTLAQASILPIGFANAILEASIGTEGDTDYYKFFAEAGSTYVAETFNVPDNGFVNTSGLRLLNASGLEVEADASGTQGTGNVDARVVYKVKTAGTYYVKVIPANAFWTGIYSVRLLARFNEPGAAWDSTDDTEPNDVLPLAYDLRVGLDQGQTHHIAAESTYKTSGLDVDYYRFVAEAERTYVIETFNLAPTNFFRKTSLQVLDATGAVRASDVSGENGTRNVNARVVFKAQTADTYFISIASATGWTGQYSIRILPKFDEPSAAWDVSDDAEPNDIIELSYALGIGANQAQTHKIVDTTTYESDKLDRDFYQFNAQSGQTYVIETFDIPPTNFFRITGTQLLDATGTQLANDDLGQNGTGNVDARIVYSITTTGTYFILVNSPTGWIGQYSVRVCPDSCTRSVYLPFIRR